MNQNIGCDLASDVHKSRDGVKMVLIIKILLPSLTIAITGRPLLATCERLIISVIFMITTHVKIVMRRTRTYKIISLV